MVLVAHSRSDHNCLSQAALSSTTQQSNTSFRQVESCCRARGAPTNSCAVLQTVPLDALHVNNCPDEWSLPRFPGTFPTGLAKSW